MDEKYLPELMAEKDSLDPSFTHALRLVNQDYSELNGRVGPLGLLSSARAARHLKPQKVFCFTPFLNNEQPIVYMCVSLLKNEPTTDVLPEKLWALQLKY